MHLNTARDESKLVVINRVVSSSPRNDSNEAEESHDDDRPSSFRANYFANKDILAGWFPQIRIDESKSWRIWLSRRSRALMLQIGIIGLILFTNLGLTIFAITSYGSENGVGLIYEGSCKKVKRLDQWIHLLINILGTGMLSASNFCMQLQAAPTRNDINRAHAQGKWLDIGIPSLRNLRYLETSRRISWGLLALSSIPIHLIYNSAVFQTLSSHSYTVAVVKNSFVNGSSWSLATAETNRDGDPAWDESRVNPPGLDYEGIIMGMQKESSKYKEMNVSACFNLYNDYWKPQGNALIFVRNETVQAQPNDSLLLYVSIVPRSDDWAKNMWALGNGTGQFVAITPPQPVEKWYLSPKRFEVSHCLVQDPESLEARCRFEYSPAIMFTVCSMNFIKAFIMLVIWIRRRSNNQKRRDKKKESKEETEEEKKERIGEEIKKEIIYTLGDAIASFMREPEEETKNMGLASKSDFMGKDWRNRVELEGDGSESAPKARTFVPEPKRWRSAARLRRWLVLILMCFLVIMIAAILLAVGLPSLRHRRFGISIPDLWSLGFGQLTQFTYLVIGLPRKHLAGLISNVLIANLPQLILSVLYLLYNTMLSTFLVQREFSRMCLAQYRKPLRVSEPIGIQRSSYFISLPLRYGIPLYASSGFMHWLVSRSLFLARIRAIAADGSDDEDNSFSTCGYSPIAILITLLVGVVMVLIIIGMGFRKYDGTMRMVSTNSLAISAACHALDEDRENGYLLPVQWGVVSISNGVGRCTFTTASEETVKLPEENGLYR